MKRTPHSDMYRHHAYMGHTLILFSCPVHSYIGFTWQPTLGSEKTMTLTVKPVMRTVDRLINYNYSAHHIGHCMTTGLRLDRGKWRNTEVWPDRGKEGAEWEGERADWWPRMLMFVARTDIYMIWRSSSSSSSSVGTKSASGQQGLAGSLVGWSQGVATLPGRGDGVGWGGARGKQDVGSLRLARMPGG